MLDRELLQHLIMSAPIKEKREHDAEPSHLETVSIQDSKSSHDNVDQGENKVC